MMSEFDAVLIVTFVPLLFITIGAIIYENKRMRIVEKNNWNNGKCPICNKKWQLDLILDDSRMYKCENGHRCRIRQNVDKIIDEY